MRLGRRGWSLGFAGRQGLPRAAVWLVPVLVLTITFGLLARDVGEFFRSNDTFIEVFERFDVDASVPVRAFLGFVVSTFTIVGVCFAVSEVGAAREEEATTRLDNLLTRAVTRRAWLLGRLQVTVAGAFVLAFALALAAGAGAGAAWGGADIAVAEFTTVAVNAVPVALCFLGITALVFAAAPRATTGFGFGLVGTAFVWQMVGSAIDAPQWSLDLSPFAHVAPVPAQAMNVAAAAVLAALGLAGCFGAVQVCARRDLQEA